MSVSREWGVGVHTCNTGMLGGRNKNRCTSEVSLVYKASSSLVSSTQQDPISKTDKDNHLQGHCQ